MKNLIVCALVVAIVVAAPREKRFTGLTLATGFGSGAGCVVTGDVLYANGLKVRNLTSNEISEMKEYENKLVEYKKQLRSNIEAHHQTMKRRMQGDDSDKVATPAEKANLTEPVKPSFCPDTLTTQYIFEGCMVQNNKVYIGREYARDLTLDEIQQLQEYDSKMTAYQKYAHTQMQKQMKNIFGGSDFFSALFSEQFESPTAPAPTEPSTNVAPEIPTAPNFCTVIY